MRSLLDKVAPLIGRRLEFSGTVICPFFIAFFTASVNDESPLGFVETLDSFASDFDEKNELLPVEHFDGSDPTRSAKGVQRRLANDEDAFGAARTGA